MLDETALKLAFTQNTRTTITDFSPACYTVVFVRPIHFPYFKKVLISTCCKNIAENVQFFKKPSIFTPKEIQQ